MEGFPGRTRLTAMLTFGVLVYCMGAHWPMGGAVTGRGNVADAQYRALLRGRSDRQGDARISFADRLMALSAGGDRPMSPGTAQPDPIPQCRGAEVEFQSGCVSWWVAQGHQ